MAAARRIADEAAYDEALWGNPNASESDPTLERTKVILGCNELTIEGHPPAGPVEFQAEPEVGTEPEPVAKPKLEVHRPDAEPESMPAINFDLEIEFTADLLSQMFAKLAAHGMALENPEAEIRPDRGDRRSMLRRRLAAAEARTAVLSEQIAVRRRAAAAEAERERRERAIEEVANWRAIERPGRDPTEKYARPARRTFLRLAGIHHPDSGGSHPGFLRVKDAYDRTPAAWPSRVR